MELIQEAINNYDVSDIINQVVIMILMLIIAGRTFRVRLQRPTLYY